MHRLRTSPSWNLSLLKPRNERKLLQKTNPPHNKDRPETRAGSIASSGYQSNSPELWSDAIEDQKDGFYRYSESLSEEEKRQASLQLTQEPETQELETQRSESPNQSMMSSIRRRPYSVSSDQWVAISTPATTPGSSPTDSIYLVPRALPLNGLDDSEIAMHFRSVLQIFSQVYFVSKFVQITSMGYGIPVDLTPGTGLMYWIEQAESGVRTRSLVDLIETTENLYYASYSRIIIELAAIELNACFRMDVPLPQTGQGSFKMPDTNHLYRIIISCKDILDSPALCHKRDEAFITRFQDAYVRFDEIPPETLTLLAERYFTMTPSQWPSRDIATEDLPFVNLEMLDEHTRDNEMSSNHRAASLAMLEGMCIGDVRRDNYPNRLMHLVRQAQCICKSTCHCATSCTYKVERPCPCAERQLRIQIAASRRLSGRFDFKTRVDSVVICCFEGLAVMKRNLSEVKIMIELHEVYRIVSMEIKQERSLDRMAT